MSIPVDDHWHMEPEEAGMNSAVLAKGLESLVKGVETDLHLGAQVYLSRHGQPVLEFACGEASAGVPMANNSILAWFSSCKPLTAFAIAKLLDAGKLQLDDPVKKHIPEFGAGKEACTIRQVLTHQGGFPMLNALEPGDTWDEEVARICAHPAEYTPGTLAGYHLSSGWTILAEIVRRLDGRPIDQYVSEEFFQPLGMVDSFMGISPEKQEELGARLGDVVLGKIGDRPHTMGIDFVDLFNSVKGREKVLPSGGARGPARELGRFYEMLLAGGRWGETDLIDARTVNLFTACHRWGLPDMTFKDAVIPWGLGVTLYGHQDIHRSASRRVFGHPGMVTSVGLADPDRGLVLVIITNGLLDGMINARRLREVSGPVFDSCG